MKALMDQATLSELTWDQNGGLLFEQGFDGVRMRVPVRESVPGSGVWEQRTSFPLGGGGTTEYRHG